MDSIEHRDQATESTTRERRSPEKHANSATVVVIATTALPVAGCTTLLCRYALAFILPGAEGEILYLLDGTAAWI